MEEWNSGERCAALPSQETVRAYINASCQTKLCPCFIQTFACKG